MSDATQSINLARFFDARPTDKAGKAAASLVDSKGVAELNGKRDFARLMSDLNKQPQSISADLVSKHAGRDDQQITPGDEEGLAGLLDQLKQILNHIEAKADAAKKATAKDSELKSDAAWMNNPDLDEGVPIEKTDKQSSLLLADKNHDTAPGLAEGLNESAAEPAQEKAPSSLITKGLSAESSVEEKSDQWLSDIKQHQGDLETLLEKQDILSKLSGLSQQDMQDLGLDEQELAQLKELAAYLADGDNQSFLAEINAKLEQLFVQMDKFTQQGVDSELSADQLAMLDELLGDIENKLEQQNIHTDTKALPEALMPLLNGVERLAEMRTAEMMPANTRPTVVDVLRALNRAAPNAVEMRSGQGMEGLERTGLREFFSLGTHAQNLNSQLNAASLQTNNSVAQNPVAQLLNERGFSAGLMRPVEAAKDEALDELKRGERSPFNLSGSTMSTGVFGNNATGAMPQAATGNPQANPQAASQMGQQIQWMVSKGVQRANIELRPADLGTIRISIETRGEETRIAMTATQQNTQGMLEQQLPRLREWLQEAGLSGAQVDVRSGNDQSTGFAEQGGQQEQASDEAEANHPELAGSEQVDSQGESLVYVDEEGRVHMQLSLFA